LLKPHHKPVYGLVVAAVSSLHWHDVRACELPTTQHHAATEIVDGRTLKLDDGSRLRLASLLSPTAYDSPSAPKQWPAEAAAIRALVGLAQHRNIAIALERPQRDRWGRHVGHALLSPPSDTEVKHIKNKWLQAILMRQGHARVALTPETSAACAELLLTLEAKAASDRLGIWREALYQAKRAEDTGQLIRLRSTYQIVEGVVARVAVHRSTVYLNFGKNWRRDFTAKIKRATLKRARLTPDDIKKIYKTPVRIRGWLEKRNGPMITIWRLEQIELLSLEADGTTARHAPPRLLSQRSLLE
jgi:endonuclease YncB( thermonuclease family)